MVVLAEKSRCETISRKHLNPPCTTLPCQTAIFCTGVSGYSNKSSFSLSSILTGGVASICLAPHGPFRSFFSEGNKLRLSLSMILEIANTCTKCLTLCGIHCGQSHKEHHALPPPGNNLSSLWIKLIQLLAARDSIGQNEIGNRIDHINNMCCSVGGGCIMFMVRLATIPRPNISSLGACWRLFPDIFQRENRASDPYFKSFRLPVLREAFSIFVRYEKSANVEGCASQARYK